MAAEKLNINVHQEVNENTNGLLRQYWPKSTNFEKITQGKVDAGVCDLNNRPKKTLDFETLGNLMGNYLAA